jgi:hypothetical protein
MGSTERSALQRSLEALSGHDSYIDFESCVVVYSWSSKMIQSGIDVITLFSSDEPRLLYSLVMIFVERCYYNYPSLADLDA